MAKSCEDVSARMMELLYGELEGNERAEVQAHVAGCARCRAELEAFEQTRAVARRVLDEPAPSRIHAAILSAAAAQARPAPRRASLWDWLRARWALPTLATVGAVAVFILGSRLFLNPERTYERGRQALAPAPPARDTEGTPAGVADQARSAQAIPSPSPEQAAAPPAADRPAGPSSAHAHGKLAHAGKPTGAAAPAPVAGLFGTAKGGRGAEGTKSDGLEGIDDLLERDDARPAAKDRARSSLGGGGPTGAASAGAAVRAEKRAFAPPPPPKPEAQKMKAPGKHEIGDNPLDGFAPAPPPRRAAPRAVAEEAQEEADEESAQPSRSVALDSNDEPREQMAAPRGKTAEKKAEKKAEQKAATETAKSSAAPAATAPAPAATAPPSVASAPPRTRAQTMDKKVSSDAGGKTGPVRETGVQRADRLFTEGRWAEAAAAYRELLRGDPRNPDAERWRRRLLAATQADVDAHRPAAAPANASPPPR